MDTKEREARLVAQIKRINREIDDAPSEARENQLIDQMVEASQALKELRATNGRA